MCCRYTVLVYTCTVNTCNYCTYCKCTYPVLETTTSTLFEGQGASCFGGFEVKCGAYPSQGPSWSIKRCWWKSASAPGLQKAEDIPAIFVRPVFCETCLRCTSSSGQWNNKDLIDPLVLWIQCQNLNFRDRWIFPTWRWREWKFTWQIWQLIEDWHWTWLGDAQWGHSSPLAFSGVLSLQSLTVRNGTSKKGMGWVSQMVNFWPWFLGGHRITVCFNHRRM